MAKKPARKTAKAMNKKGMKKTKGGLIGLLRPAAQAVEYSPKNSEISGNISGNTVNGDGANPGTLTNSFTGGV